MAGFSAWNWFLACTGHTSIEFWSNFGGVEANKAKLNFDTANDNLYRVFGTHKMFRILSPSLRNVPFTGLEWSFMMKDDGYDCNGNKLESNDSENQGTEKSEDCIEEEDTEMEMVLINQKPRQVS